MTLVRIPATILVLLATLLGSPAQANDVEEARASFAEGVGLLDQGRFAEAAAAFERSVAALETPHALFNLGLARRGSGQLLQAIEALSRLSTLRDTDPTLRNEAVALIEEIRPSLVQVELEFVGEPSEIRIDGTSRDQATPTTLVLNPGEHTFYAQQRGYEPIEETRTLAPGTRHTIQLDLQTRILPVELRIDVEPDDASVWIDGELIGQGSVTSELLPGTHQVEVRSGRRDPFEREIELEPGENERLDVSLARVPVVRRWWLWTLVGALTAAAIGTAIAVTAGPGIDQGTTGATFSTLRDRTR